jgi:formate dehydrogenase subunit gamma
MAQFEPFTPQRAFEIAFQHADREGPLLPVLHELLETFGHVPDEATPIVADVLNLSRADVHGVITFYHDYRREPAGRHVLKLCRAEACQARGGDAVAEETAKRLGVEIGSTSADGRTTFEAVYCLGLCASGPSAMIDGKLVGRLTTGDRLEKLLAEARS